MPTYLRLPCVLLLTITLGTLGCSGNAVPEESIQSAESAMDQATASIEAGDFATALPLLEQAVDSPGLNIDQYVEAVLLRAQCYASAGEFEKAEADIAEAEQGAPDDALLHYTKAVLLFKQGDTARGNKEFSAARKFDRSLKKPS